MRLDVILDRGRGQGFTTADVAALERRLNVLAAIHGATADIMWENCRELAVICNSLAMGEARGLPLAQDLLTRALALTVKTDVNQQDPERWKLRAVTYNNLACHFRRLAAEVGPSAPRNLCHSGHPATNSLYSYQMRLVGEGRQGGG